MKQNFVFSSPYLKFSIMERCFDSSFGWVSLPPPLFPTISSDNSVNVTSDRINESLYSHVPLPSDFSIAFTQPDPFPYGPTFTFFNEAFPLYNHQLSGSGESSSTSAAPPHQLSPVFDFISVDTLRVPKQEQFFFSDQVTNQPLTVPYNVVFDTLNVPKSETFFETATTTKVDFFSSNLPDLHSLESPSSQKRVRFGSIPTNATANHHPHALTFNVSELKNPSIEAATTSSSTTKVAPHKELAKRRRQKFSEKVHCLRKLMPWETKMDTATLLAEACKYVKFLQAQINALQLMPFHSSFNDNGGGGGGGDGGMYGDLEVLNRRQLLQVFLNSPVAQTWLYSQGRCVYSIEQLVFLKKVTERRAAMQEVMMFGTTGSC